MLGIRNLTWEEVEATCGFRREDFAGFDYKKRKPTGGQTEDQGPKAPPYGRWGGLLLSDVPNEGLEMYEKGCKKQIADPSKADYRDRNTQQLQAIQQEQAKRKKAEKPATATEAPVRPNMGRSGRSSPIQHTWSLSSPLSSISSLHRDPLSFTP